MSAGWLDIHSSTGVQRERLVDGLTRCGGGKAEVPLGGVGEDQLCFWGQPPRVRFEGRGPVPLLNGKPLAEVSLVHGDRIDWAGFTLVFATEGPAREASLEELVVPAEQVTPPTGPGADGLARRVRAGIACELGLAERGALKRWQEAVLAGRFEPEACARELVPSALGPEAEQRILERGGSLLRDFVMAPYLEGAKGASRKVRGGLRNMAGFLVAQAVALLVFSAIVAAILLVLRVKGKSLDGWLDRLIDLVP